MASSTLPPAPYAVGKQVLEQVVEGLMSGDASKQHATIARFFHPDATYKDHMYEVHGRWQIFRAQRVESTFFAIRPQIVRVVEDRDGLRGIVVVNQLFKARVPLVGRLLPELVLPMLMEFGFERTPDGAAVLIRELTIHVSITYLPNLLGPPGVWVHKSLIIPLSGWALAQVQSVLEFGQAVSTFTAQQLRIGKPRAVLPTGH